MIATWTRFFEKMAVRNDLVYSCYNLYYKKVVSRELGLASIKKTDRILLIGGGSIPCTAIEFAESTRAKIDVIDIDERAVDNARDLIERKGLKDRIKVRLADGKMVDTSNYDVIHIAMQVSPKEGVLEHILNQSSQGVRVILREPKQVLRKFYSNVSKSFLEKYSLDLREEELRSLTTMDRIKILVKTS